MSERGVSSGSRISSIDSCVLSAWRMCTPSYAPPPRRAAISAAAARTEFDGGTGGKPSAEAGSAMHAW